MVSLPRRNSYGGWAFRGRSATSDTKGANAWRNVEGVMFEFFFSRKS